MLHGHCEIQEYIYIFLLINNEKTRCMVRTAKQDLNINLSNQCSPPKYPTKGWRILIWKRWFIATYKEEAYLGGVSRSL